MAQSDMHEDSTKTIQSTVGGRKDAFVRRKELLVESGFAEVRRSPLLRISKENYSLHAYGGGCNTRFSKFIVLMN